MLVGGRRSVSCIFTLVHLVETLLPSEGSYPLCRTRGRRALLVWMARAGMGDLTLAVLKLQLLFISSPPPLPPSPLFSSVISAPLFHLPSSLLVSPRPLSSAPLLLFQLPSPLDPRSPALSPYFFFFLSSLLLSSTPAFQLNASFFPPSSPAPRLLSSLSRLCCVSKDRERVTCIRLSKTLYLHSQLFDL